MDCFFFFLLSVASSSSRLTFTGDGAIRNIEAAEGHNSTLPCSKAAELELSVLQWIRSDLDKRLLVFRGAVLEGYEDSLYRNRVELLDPQLQHKDLSLVLKVVTVKDSGTYRCKAVYEDDEEVQEISQFIRLTVTEHERDVETENTLDEDDEVAFVLLLLIPVIALFIFFKTRSKEAFVLREPPSSEESKEHPALSSNSSSSSLASSASTAALIPNRPPPSETEQSTPEPPPYSWSAASSCEV